MLGTLINKELRAMILSPKFVGIFSVCSVLILLSVYSGIREYQIMNNQYEAASQLADQNLRQKTSWGYLTTQIYRKPDPMRIFVSGLDYDIGRWSPVSEHANAKLKNSAYSNDLIYAVFRFIDFSFITRFVLSLFALLLTYNAVNGEREKGTLKLILSNAVPRAKYLIGKCVGAWLGLIIPTSIPLLLAILMVLVFDITMTAAQWFNVALIIIMSMSIFTFFIVLGVFLSTLTRRSSVSFLLGLVCWVLLVMIIPRAGVTLAGQIVPVPRVTEIESQLAGFSHEKWQSFYDEMDDRMADIDFLANDDAENEAAMWEMMIREDSLRNEIEAEIGKHGLMLRNDLRQHKLQQDKLAFALSRFSPVSAYQLGAMNLAGTDIYVKTRYEDDINNYKNRFYDFVKQKQKETGDLGQIMMAITIDEGGNQEISTDSKRNKSELDFDGMPQFRASQRMQGEVLSELVIDFGIITIFSIIMFAGSFYNFIRYDAR